MSEQRQTTTYHVRVQQADKTAIDWLQEVTQFSRQHLKQVLQKGAVWLASGGKPRRLRRAGKKLKEGDELYLYYNPEVLEQQPPTAILVKDEGDFSVWYKPPGMLAQGSKWGDHTTICRWAETHLEPQRNAFAVHRLDRAASGLIMVAHTKSMAAALSKLFAERQVEKQYEVQVEGGFPEQAEGMLLQDPLDNRTAISRVWLQQQVPGENRSLLKVTIETGRKHQIRRHLAAAGFPLVGDRLYGAAGSTDDLQLCACYLKFTHPVTGSILTYVLPEPSSHSTLPTAS